MTRFWRVGYEPQETPCVRQAQGTMSVQLAHRCVWHDDNWSPRRIWSDWLRDRKSKWMDRLEVAIGRKVPWRSDRFSGGTHWPDGHPKPRTCSYCGGVHPDDAAGLVLRGWEVECTSKPYKRYLHPPGYSAAIQTTRESGFTTWNGPPVPPVKVYTYHFDGRQRAAFNAAIDAPRRD